MGRLGCIMRGVCCMSTPRSSSCAHLVRLLRSLAAAVLGVSLMSSSVAVGTPRQLKLLAPAAYLPQLPVVVRLEVIDAGGRRDWMLWDAEALLSSDSPGILLSTNRVVL